eukprot:TRINITY_DN1968_c1_g1_i1.p1 TRINITY_DN1968_c1_g1~~TRINITY_DN1968_c1_g1_i1.p1  ORF type:complete len:410 (-),score=116.18 TRINITY_DN1968_c1_g1_i1:40-1242(-)
MRLKRRDIQDGQGSVTLIPEEPEDMWHTYNLITKGDLVRCSTLRKVQSESSTGSTSAEKVRVILTIQISSIDFDPQGGLLRIGGQNVSESKYVRMGAFHTLDLEANREFTLTKSEWDIVSLERIKDATDPTRYADVGAIVLAEGLAHVCLITSSMTIVRARIEHAIPRKRRGSVTVHDKGLQKFFEQILQAMIRHFNFEVIKCIIIASPGFVKDQFYEYMMAEVIRQDMKTIMENKSKILLVHSSSGHKHALKEVLSDPQVVAKLSDTKASGEIRALNDFYDMMKTEPDRAVYGLKHVEYSTERLAVQTLLLTDSLFRSSDIEKRRRYIRLVETVKASTGDVKIFSAMHVSGEQLGQITGVAAILRFPLPELDDLEEEEDNASVEETPFADHSDKSEDDE